MGNIFRFVYYFIESREIHFAPLEQYSTYYFAISS